MRIIKKLLTALIICCTCLASFASCSGGIDGDRAKAFINDFFAAIVEEDYQKAETFLHPERPCDLKTFFISVEEETSLDFQAGIIIERYKGLSAAYYDSTVGGSTYELTMKTNVGESTVDFTIEIVQNQNGYGIYNLDIDT
ncbi:MAG: hypothetical protein E7638_05915 [Ruminococcaceae bacterium]|nr:hypothetical protein [Oscillospiraceae bacterium]